MLWCRKPGPQAKIHWICVEKLVLRNGNIEMGRKEAAAAKRDLNTFKQKN